MIIADDFGLGRGHDAVMLRLLEAGKIDGVSVMVNDALAPSDVARLRALRAQGAQVGLHLNLTQSLPGTPALGSINALLLRALTGTLPRAAFAALSDQLARFTALFGPPDFLDGHQHVHILPGLSRAVARAAPGAWLRLPLAPDALNRQTGGRKVALLNALASRAARRFADEGRRANAAFSGFLRLDDPSRVATDLPRLLAAKEPETLLMVHPGDAADPMQCPGHAPEARALEARILEACDG